LLIIFFIKLFLGQFFFSVGLTIFGLSVKFIRSFFDFLTENFPKFLFHKLPRSGSWSTPVKKLPEKFHKRPYLADFAPLAKIEKSDLFRQTFFFAKNPLFLFKIFKILQHHHPKKYFIFSIASKAEKILFFPP